MLMLAKAFARQAFNPIALMSTFHMLFGDGKTDAGMPQRVPAAENSNIRRASPLRLLEDESEMIGS
ncbi:RNase P [Pectobacterium cacticida]